MILRFFATFKRCLFVMLISIFLCTLLLVESIYALTEIDENSLYAKSAVLMDAKTKRVLYEKNGYEEMPMASTTKIMTCIIALENADNDLIVEVSDYAASMPAVHLTMKAGEEYYLKDLLYSLMLESHNDTAVAIAEAVGGDTDSFIKLMNDKAMSIGCEHTLFLTPNGLDKTIKDDFGNSLTHHTTAADLARIMSYCINESPKCEEFIKITKTNTYTFSDVSGKRNFTCNNHNSFLNMMEGALSGKTGFTAKAGYCYVGALEREDKKFVVALLACGWPDNKNYKWKDTKQLMNYGIDNYNNKKIEIPYKEFKYHVLNGEYDSQKVSAAYVNAAVDITESEYMICDNDDVKIIYENEKCVEAPVRKGDILGSVCFYINDDLVCQSYITAKENIKEKSVKWAFTEIVHRFFGKYSE